MRLVTSILLALCLVAFVSATCLSHLGELVDANSGSTDVTLTETSDLSDPSACKALLATFTGQTQCCSADALTKLATIGGNIHALLEKAKTDFNTAISSIDLGANLDQQTKDAINQVPQLKKLYNDIVNAINTFKSRSPGHFDSCVTRIENYVAGALCSLCRPDFVPTILTIDNSTGTVKRTWKWAPATCDGLSNSCSPLWNDVDQLLLAFYDALITVITDPQFASFFNGSDFTTEFPHRDDIRPCVQMAREIQGSNTDISKACRTTICYGLVHGLRNPSVFEDNSLGALNDFTKGLGQKRGSSDFSGLVARFARVSKSFRMLGNSVKRQSSSADNMDYTGTVDATATGSQNTVGIGGGKSSAATLFVSAFAAVIVLVALLF
jgi:hypothetical protein